MDSVASVDQTQNVAPKKPNWLSISLVAILVLTSIGAAVYLFCRNLQLKKQLNQTVQITSIEEPSPTPDVTEGWKTYTNLSYKYQIKIPLECNVLDNEQKTTESSVTEKSKKIEIVYPDKIFPKNDITVESYDSFFSGDIWNSQMVGRDVLMHPDTSIEINGFKAYDMGESFIESGSPDSALKNYIYIVENPNKHGYIRIIFTYRDPEGARDRVFNQILSTFKFLD